MRTCYRGCFILLRRGNKVIGYELAITFVSEAAPKWVDCEITWSKTLYLCLLWLWEELWGTKRPILQKEEHKWQIKRVRNECGPTLREHALFWVTAASRVCCFFRSQHYLTESLAWPPSHRSSSSPPPDQSNPPVEVEQGRTGLRSTVIYPRIKGQRSLWAGVHKRTRMLECRTHWNRPRAPGDAPTP